MTVCPHCFTDSALVGAQSRKITMLEEEKRALIEMIADSKEPPPIRGMTANEAKILSALLRNERVSRSTIMSITKSRAEDYKIVDVWICKLRKKIKPLGLEIKNIWGEGYFIPRESKDAFKAAEAA